jgi:hypothetical protein
MLMCDDMVGAMPRAAYITNLSHSVKQGRVRVGVLTDPVVVRSSWLPFLGYVERAGVF